MYIVLQLRVILFQIKSLTIATTSRIIPDILLLFSIPELTRTSSKMFLVILPTFLSSMIVIDGLTLNTVIHFHMYNFPENDWIYICPCLLFIMVVFINVKIKGGIFLHNFPGRKRLDFICAIASFFSYVYFRRARFYVI